jgi:hypothetical protein
LHERYLRPPPQLLLQPPQPLQPPLRGHETRLQARF